LVIAFLKNYDLKKYKYVFFKSQVKMCFFENTKF
jgi:hypothetical protein